MRRSTYILEDIIFRTVVAFQRNMRSIMSAFLNRGILAFAGLGNLSLH